MKLGTYTFKEFQAEYPDDEACLRKLMEVRYGGIEIVCPGCGEQSKFHPLSKRKAFTCQLCGFHIYPCADTIFHKSSTNLTKWFFAMYLMTTTRHGVAAKELERQIGCTYKTAWRMAHELRKLMADTDYQGLLGGVVEADETYLGGKRPGKRGRGAEGKTAVFGMVERNGKVRAAPVEDVTEGTLKSAILENVVEDSIVVTDEFKSYDGLEKSARGKLTHYRINHGLKEYAFEGVHVNTLEGYWSRLKNSIKGTHVHISEKHTWKYVCEFSFRYNMRKQQAEMFATLISSV